MKPLGLPQRWFEMKPLRPRPPKGDLPIKKRRNEGWAQTSLGSLWLYIIDIDFVAGYFTVFCACAE